MEQIIHSVTFTPNVTGTLRLSVTFNSGGSGDLGYTVKQKLFVTQDGVTTYGAEQSTVESTASPSDKYLVEDFAVDADLEVECGLYGIVTGAAGGTWRRINILYQLVR